MSAEKPLLVVLGATGNQGGSVVSYFLSLSSSPYAIRGVTRNLSSPKSVSLASLGVEMVAGNFDDPSSLDAAFKGVSVIFTVTDFWHSFFDPSVREKASASGESIGVVSRDNETQQNKNIIDAAAKVSTLERFVFSSLPNTSKLSGGKYPYVYHFDGKALGEEYGSSAHPKLWEKTTVFYAGYYLENFFSPAGKIVRPKLNKSKTTLTLYVAEPLATASLPMYSSIADTGALVHAVVHAAPGKKVIGVNEWLNLREFATILAQVLEKRIEFIDREPKFELGDAEMEKDHVDMVGFCIEFGYDGGKVDKSIVQPADLGVPVQLASVKEWCEKQDWENILEVE
ncbi:hypothetical protein UA08_03438 [Talaromyces atroroseus]|uniref:NmrA-like domain-containing protein n=1 Tax=Talaromyces atroroseus TaxID=1441469 RepID=A0A225ATE8_TALAT|nr:hypothetical protein UA08_03438 [Talaromyces atroroseus]OKL61634.1 hypothetical protein UA08_03438 [Talaromyces atroroseus]